MNTNSYDRASDSLKEEKEKLAAELITANKELALQKEYLGKLVDYANAPIIVWDPQFHITRFNQALEAMTGRLENEVIGKSLEFLFPRAEVDSSMATIKTTTGRERWEMVETSIIHTDGSVRTVLWNSATVFDADGKTPIGTIAQGQDITQYKQVQDALLDNEAKYRTLVENIPQKILMKDRNYCWVSINENLARDFGFRPEEVVGKVDADLFPPELAAKYHADDVRIMETGKTEELVERYLKDGKETWVNTIKTPVRDAHGEIVGLLWVFWDITERKLAAEAIRKFSAELEQRVIERTAELEAVNHELEAFSYEKEKRAAELIIATKELAFQNEEKEKRAAELIIANKELAFQNEEKEKRAAELTIANKELQESKELMDAVVENVPLMIFLKEAEDLRFVVLNKAGEDLLGYDRKDLIGKNDLDLFPPEQAALLLAKDRESLAANTLIDIPEEQILTAKKVARLLHTRKICIKGADGVTKYLLGISEDITERKQMETKRLELEEQLRVSQKLEAIGSLAGGIAHDFNNLLSVILSYTGFAIEVIPDGDLLKEDLLEVKKAADRAVVLIRQLLAFGRKQVLQLTEINLNSVIEGIQKTLSKVLGESIDYAQVLAPDLGLTLVDTGQIEQVLVNLVVNARDAMPEGGKLTIETANVEIDEEYVGVHVDVKPGSYVQLTVSDTGCGMDEQTQMRLFEPFLTTKKMGNGLGLSTVYGIIKQSGGSIWVYSELGQGTTFKIYLPRVFSTTAATVTEPATIPTKCQGIETILVVEDEDALRKVIERSLERAGYRVLIASNGDEALLQSAQYADDIHLLLTDVVMPRMGGRVVAQELSKTRPTIKIVYMSGYTDDIIVRHGVLNGGTHFLAKPFTSAALRHKVREVLDIGSTKSADGHEKAFKNEAEKEEKQPLDRDALSGLSPDVLAKLHNAITAARYGEIIKIIETVRVTEPNVASELRRMADLFDYEGMRSLLNGGTESKRDR